MATSVDAFFHEMVTEAIEEADLAASQPAEWYLVNLLGEFTKARLTDAALGVKLVEPTADAGERVKNLKEVGDTSLYVVGYFSESLQRSLVDRDYYVGLGQTAYAQLARHLSVNSYHGGHAIADVYAELAERFPSFVDVLMAVRRRVDYSSADTTKLYEQWLKTRDAWIEQRLRQAGLIVNVDPGDGVLQ